MVLLTPKIKWRTVLMLDAFRQDLITKLGETKLAKIEKAKIGIAGAGGLGSNCAACLVRVGFKRLTIADFDVIDATNLDRQFYFEDQVGTKKVEALRTNLLRINPELELQMLPVKLEPANIPEIFRDCDVVVECLDRAEAKSMLVAALLSSGKLIVSASGLGGYGSSDDLKVRKLKTNLVLIGDLASDIAQSPALSPRVSIAAAKQADVVLEYVVRN
ncbi:MAG: sulfur carrier protein ThiS adenylyltransferase ThiF [Candidatus Omnitrophica bacterium]|nr:sulfur carrier protein ThiS adenylyltransferase ThiF [Candidatus Omnitrophota bacterium]